MYVELVNSDAKQSSGLVCSIQRAPRLLVGRDDLQTLRHSFNHVSSPAWKKQISGLAHLI